MGHPGPDGRKGTDLKPKGLEKEREEILGITSKTITLEAQTGQHVTVRSVLINQPIRQVQRALMTHKKETDIGYTNFWVLLPGFSREAFAQAAQDMTQIINHSETLVAGPDGIWDTFPEITPTRVAFNGVDWTSADAAHHIEHLDPAWDESGEGFELDADKPGWEYCKTYRRPYDSIVAACLLAAKHHLPEHFYISSEGSWDEEWAHGARETNISPVKLYEYRFPERSPVSNPLGTSTKVLEEGIRLHQERLYGG